MCGIGSHWSFWDKCVSLARKEGIKLRRSYVRTTKQPVRDTYNGRHPKRRKKANAAKRKLRTIAGRLVRELERKLPSTAHRDTLELFKRVLSQTRTGNDKIYSLHEPGVYCIASPRERRTRNMNMAVRLHWP